MLHVPSFFGLSPCYNFRQGLLFMKEWDAFVESKNAVALVAQKLVNGDVWCCFQWLLVIYFLDLSILFSCLSCYGSSESTLGYRFLFRANPRSMTANRAWHTASAGGPWFFWSIDPSVQERCVQLNVQFSRSYAWKLSTDRWNSMDMCDISMLLQCKLHLHLHI